MGLAIAIILVVAVALFLFDSAGERARSQREGAAADRTSPVAGEAVGDPDSGQPDHGPESGPKTIAGPRAKSKAAVCNVVVGRVVDAAGVPVRRARVSITAFLDPFAPGGVFTDEDGRYSVPCHPKVPEKVGFVVRHPQFTALENVKRPTEPGLQFVLKRGLQIHGHVRFPDGTPVRGLAVQGRAIDVTTESASDEVIRASMPTGVVRTNERGAFRLGGFESRDPIPAPAARVPRRPSAGAVKTVIVQHGSANRADFAMPPSGSVRVLLEKGNNVRLLLLETLDGRRLQCSFSCMNGDGRWISDSQVAFGRYRLLEWGASGVQRRKEIEIAEAGMMSLDWRE